jgi:hypothetical protein
MAQGPCSCPGKLAACCCCLLLLPAAAAACCCCCRLLPAAACRHCRRLPAAGLLASARDQPVRLHGGFQMAVSTRQHRGGACWLHAQPDHEHAGAWSAGLFLDGPTCGMCPARAPGLPKYSKNGCTTLVCSPAIEHSGKRAHEEEVQAAPRLVAGPHRHRPIVATPQLHSSLPGMHAAPAMPAAAGSQPRYGSAMQRGRLQQQQAATQRRPQRPMPLRRAALLTRRAPAPPPLPNWTMTTRLR